jgi:hypothetical protein
MNILYRTAGVRDVLGEEFVGHMRRDVEKRIANTKKNGGRRHLADRRMRFRRVEHGKEKTKKLTY